MQGVSLGKRADQISRQVFGRPVGQVLPKDGPIALTPKREPALDRGHLIHFWHPDRDGVERAPNDFLARLRAVKSTLMVVRPPVAAPVPYCWYLWEQRPNVTHALCPGWFLLLPWSLDGRALPLDEKFFAALWHFDPRNCGGAVKYFDRVIAERDRKRAEGERHYRDERLAQQKDFLRSRRISTAGRGSKFAMHHDGSVVPSRGELAWTIENQRHTLPSEIVTQQRLDRERTRDE